MNSPGGSLPHQTPAAPLPIHVRPVHGERSGSYLIRVATSNRCPPRTLLQLLGRVHHRSRPDRWVELRPQSAITLNTAALHRLATYSAIPAVHLLRALPELGHEHGNGEPILRVSPPTRAFLRSCPDCERRAGGAALAPDRRRMQLLCARHGVWLVNADPPLDTAPVPEVSRAARTLRRQQHRHHADTISALYRHVRECLTNDWRGLGWHTHLAKRWEARQQILRPDTAGKDRYLLARTEHWSMLPEAVAVITVLANHHHDTLTGQRHLTRSLSRALHLDSYWSTGTGEHFDAHHILVPLRQQTAERARPARITSNPYRSPQPVSVGAAR
jgi:hypothetical protein